MNARLFAALLPALAVMSLSATEPAAQQGAAGQKARAGQADQAARPGGPVPQPKRDKIFDVGATWIATSLNGKPFSGERPSFAIDQQYRARGFGGCNTFSATAYPLREQRLAVSPLLFTKKTCDKATMASERAFFVAFRYAERWDLQGSTLTVKTQNGELRFERAL